MIVARSLALRWEKGSLTKSLQRNVDSTTEISSSKFKFWSWTLSTIIFKSFFCFLNLSYSYPVSANPSKIQFKISDLFTVSITLTMCFESNTL